MPREPEMFQKLIEYNTPRPEATNQGLLVGEQFECGRVRDGCDSLIHHSIAEIQQEYAALE